MYDLEKDWHDVALPVSSRAAELAATPAQQRAVAIAACRHSLDQAAILPVNGSLTHSVTLGLRRTLAGNADAFRSALDARGLKIDLTSLVPFARWVTPVTEARRFDTCFFITRAPAGQDGLVGEAPEVSRFWAGPAAVLARWEQGQVALDPPAHYTLSTLSTLRDVDEALALAKTLPLTPIQPHVIDYDGTVAQTLPGDPEHPEHVLVLRGQTRYVLRGAHWRPEPEPLA